MAAAKASDRIPEKSSEELAAERREKRRRGRGKFECELGILFAILGLIATRLGNVWIGFDVFSHFSLHFSLALIAFLIGRFMPRARLFTAMLVMLAGIVAIGVWPHVASLGAGTVGAPAAGEKVLRVAQFNTWYFNENIDAVGTEIERLDADIVTLAEFGPNKRPLLDRLKYKYPYQATCNRIDFCNLVVLSKHPFESDSARVEWEGPPYISVRFGPELGRLTVFGVHTIRFPYSRAQFKQVRALARLLASLPEPRLVMGDFNATPFSRILATFAEESGLTRVTDLPSWPAELELPQFAIDHIFIDEGMRTVSAESIGNPSGSDHFPVVVTIAVRTGDN